MQVAMIGLGRMGINMARRLLRAGHEVVAYNRSAQKTQELAKEGAKGCYSLEGLVQQLTPPRIVWLMLPAGPVVEEHIEKLAALLSREDIVVEGGNSFYKDDLKRAEALEKRGIKYLDVGVSGGIWGLDNGYCLMVGGPQETFHRLEPVFEALSGPEAYLYCGPTGAGHFVKMIHNGIEYAMMQAYAEGFELIDSSPYGEGLDYSKLARLWNNGSVIRSWLLELAEKSFGEDPGLSRIKGYVEDSGEGRWTVKEAVEMAVPAPVIALSLFERFRSRKEDTFGNRFLAALRHKFGGHPVVEKK